MERLSDTLISEFKDHAVLRMQESADKIRGCLNLLDEDAFWFQPNEQSNSPDQLLRHLKGNITQYIISGLGDAPDLRNRDAEFIPGRNRDRNRVESAFFEAISAAIEMIGSANAEDLTKIRRVQGFAFSGIGIILHVVEHLSYHTGQFAYLTKLNKNVDLGFYRDFDLNQTNE